MLQRRTSGRDMDLARTSRLDIPACAFCLDVDLALTSKLDTRVGHSFRVDIGVTSGTAVGGITALARAGRGLAFTRVCVDLRLKKLGRAGAS
jgi:hypothetical protein